MDQIWRKPIFEVKRLCLVAAMLLFGSVDAHSAGNCVWSTDPRPETQNCPDVSGGVRPIPKVLAELTAPQVASLDIAMRELRARRRDWKLYGITLAKLDGTLIVAAQRPDDTDGRQAVTINVDEKTFRVKVTDWRNQKELQ